MLDAFNTVSKSINESSNNITENNKTFTELINNLLLEVTTTNRKLLDNNTRERNVLYMISIKKLKNENDFITKCIDRNSYLVIIKI